MGELSKRLDEAGAQNKRLSGELDAQRSLANERGKVLETQKSELSQKITDLEKKLKAATDELERLKASASVKPPTEKVLPRWVRIPAGEFDMGCSPGDKDWEKDELPRHRVTISRASEMSETEITLGTYRRFAEQPGRQMPPKAQFPQQDSHPVVNVTWNEAQDFCKWVGASAHRGRMGTLRPRRLHRSPLWRSGRYCMARGQLRTRDKTRADQAA